MKNIRKTVIYDLDGCLIQTLGIWLSAYQKCFRELGLGIPDTTVASQIFGDWGAPARYGVIDLDSFINKLVNEVNINFPQAKLYPTVRSTLERLNRAGIKVALVTSSRRQSVSMLLENLSLNKYFEPILTAEDVKKRKPDPEVVLKAIQIIGADISNTYMVGDYSSDIFAAKAAGVKSILFFPEKHKKYYDYDKFKKLGSDYIITRHDEIINIIQ